MIEQLTLAGKAGQRDNLPTKTPLISLKNNFIYKATPSMDHLSLFPQAPLIQCVNASQPRWHLPLPPHFLAACTYQLAGVGKGPQVHRLDLSVWKVPHSAFSLPFSQSQEKPLWNYLSVHHKTGVNRGERGGRRRRGGGKRPWEAPDNNAFQVETRSWTIRGETADLVNSGPPRAHLLMEAVSARCVWVEVFVSRCH